MDKVIKSSHTIHAAFSERRCLDEPNSLARQIAHWKKEDVLFVDGSLVQCHANMTAGQEYQ
jgi:hypothetical protein